MQQHHATHALRPPHMRATTHHMHQHAATGPPPQHIAINLGPPQQQNAAGPIIQLQHQQQHQIQAQNSNYMPQQTQHNRLSHHHPQQQQQQRHHLMQSQHRGNQQTIQATTQMQKLRQQHQLVNSSNNNNNNSNNKSNGISNQHQQQLQQQQQQQHMAGQPQQIQQHQRNIHHTTQQHVSNVKHKQQHQQPLSCTHIAPSANVIKPQQQQQSQSHSQQQTQHGYASGTNAMYNNNSNNSNNKNTNNNDNKNNHNHSPVENSPAPVAIVPKSILQNPNRSTNSTSKQQHKNVVLVTTPASTDTTPKEATTTTNVHVPVKNMTEAAAAATATTTTPIVSAKLATTETETTALPAATLSVVSSESLKENAIPQDNNSNKENDDPTTNNACNQLPGDNVIPSECLGASNSAAACKEKTPMCLVNELARLNKITHQYRLTNEKGPAHCKSFTVTLKLGEEEYSAEGYKIKKAQHLAAAKALENTKYQHPIPKLSRRSEEGGASRATITPTVELNALAMKLGQPTYYLFDPLQQPPMDAVLPPPPPGPGPDLYGPRPHGPPVPHGGGPLMPPPPPHHMFDPNNPYMRRHAAQYHPRFNNYRGVPIPGVPGYMHPNKIVRYRLMAPPVLGHNGGGGGMPPHAHVGYPPPSAPCKITLIVGKQKFIGTGRTLQSAKHDAASRALQVIRTQAANQLNEILNRSMEESDSKSPISLVHEIGIKRNMPVHFKVLREEGPAHMKNFITACFAGTIVTEGCGNGKKISKKRAAQKMLEELKQLPPLSPSKSPVKRFKVKPSGRVGAAAAGRFGAERSKKRVGGASIKENGETLDIETEKENPISNLIMLLQSRNEPEPVYELISKNGSETTRRREFIMEVSAAGKVARGRGNNTKLAKRNAAQNLLEILSNESASSSLDDRDAEVEPMPQQTVDSVGPKSSVTELVAEDNEEAVKLSSMSTAATSSALPTVTTSSGQVPGILILRQHKKHSIGKNSLKHAAASPSNAATPSTQKQAASTTKVAVAPVTTTTTTTINTPTAAISEPSNTKTTDSIDNAGSASAAHNTSSTLNSSSSNTASSSGLRMKKQLLYLAQVLGFEVDFSDYPKGNHNEFLTIVTLSTTPEQICHGTGATSEESQNDAAKNALKILSDLDDVNSGKAK